LQIQYAFEQYSRYFNYCRIAACSFLARSILRMIISALKSQDNHPRLIILAPKISKNLVGLEGECNRYRFIYITIAIWQGLLRLSFRKRVKFRSQDNQPGMIIL
jgi:hypothetical protein